MARTIEERLIAWLNGKNIETLLVINPDNPSGNYIEKKDVLKLVEWTEQKGIKFLVDESFVDFARGL